MANTIILKKSSTAGVVPTTAQLQVGELAVNTNDGRLYARGNNGSDFVKEIGASEQRGLKWEDVSGLAPGASYEFDSFVNLFGQGLSQAMIAVVKVPYNYVAGTAITLRLGHYTSGVANNFKLRTTTTLVRKNTDAFNSTTNQYTSTNADQAISATQYRYHEIVYDLTTSAGLINSVAVSAGDLIKISLARVATTGTEDANDVRVLPGTAEILF